MARCGESAGVIGHGMLLEKCKELGRAYSLHRDVVSQTTNKEND
jgi:hypothetical protein